MSAGFALLAGGTPADDIMAAMQVLEVEENADAPGAFSITLPLSVVDGELNWVGDERLAPMAPIAIVARAAEGNDECLLDGYVLAHSLKLSPGTTDSSLRIWGQDASWEMNTTERARVWTDVSDANVAASIFGEYGFAPSATNSADDSPMHSEAGNSLVQRDTDAQFLMRLAKRSGKLFRVTTAGLPGERTGIFARPKLDGEVVATLNVTDVANANVSDIEIGWDVMRPTTASSAQALLTAAEPASAEESEGLTLLDERGLSDFSGNTVTALAGAIVDDPAELSLRAQATLIDGGFFVRATGRADVARLGTVLRVGTLVLLDMAGSVHSGAYYVWSVRHSITSERHEMRFQLVRNAVGPAPSGGGLL